MVKVLQAMVLAGQQPSVGLQPPTGAQCVNRDSMLHESVVTSCSDQQYSGEWRTLLQDDRMQTEAVEEVVGGNNNAANSTTPSARFVNGEAKQCRSLRGHTDCAHHVTTGWAVRRPPFVECC